MTRRCIVYGLANTNTNYQTLGEVYTALDSASLTFNSAPTDFTNLLLVERNVRMIDIDKAEVDLVYVAKADAGLNWTFRGGTSMRSVQSNVDRFGALIQVTDGNTTQNATIDVTYPVSVMQARGVLARERPYVTAHLWSGRLNSTEWGTAPAGAAMITSCDYEPLDLSLATPTWLFTFEITIDLTGWLPQVWHQDSSGRPSQGITYPFGYRVVQWYPFRDFNELFPL